MACIVCEHVRACALRPTTCAFCKFQYSFLNLKTLPGTYSHLFAGGRCSSGCPWLICQKRFLKPEAPQESSFPHCNYTGFHFFLKRSEKLELTVTGPYSPLQVIERFGRTRVEVARAAAVLDGVGLRLPCSGAGGTGLHELAHLVVHGRVDLGGGAQVAAAEGCVGAGKLEHGGLG